ncbi:UNVERIFIED_CONTAM: hypothetical protein Cloal_2480 [Acetivibrio alkalicellulosi]
MKKIIIIVLAVILTILIGVVLPILINSPSRGLNEVEDQDSNFALESKSRASSEREANSIGEQSTDSSEYILNGRSDYSVVDRKIEINQGNNDSGFGKDTNGNEEGDDTSPKNTSPETNASNGGSSNEGSSVDENDFLTEDWVEEMIKKHGNRIRENDLDDLRRLYSKVNIAYLQGIVDGGITDEGFEEIKSYLHSTLGSDYARGRELYFMYSHLMMEI